MSWTTIGAFVLGLMIGPVLLFMVLAFLAAVDFGDDEEQSAEHQLGIGANG